MTEPRYWFADIDRDQDSDHIWQPCLETGQGYIPTIDIWFTTEQECFDWMAEHLNGTPIRLPDAE